MMKSMLVLLATSLVIGALFATPVAAQKGMGDKEGIARSGDSVDSLEMTAILESVHLHPCEKTTGKAPEGMHLHVLDKEGNHWNIHLGPTGPVQRVIGPLEPGAELTISGFTSETLPEKHLVASTLQCGDQIWRLRDKNLRPVWREKFRRHAEDGIVNERT